MTGSDGAGGGVPPWLNRRFLVLAGLWILSVAGNAYFIVPASVFPLIMTDLAIGPATVGWVVSAMVGVQVLTGVPIGMGLDRRNNRLLVAIGSIGVILGCVWGWRVAVDFPALLASRMAAGVALMVVWNAGVNIVGRSFPDSTRATAVAVFTTSAPAGLATGQITGPLIAESFGWPAIFVAYAPVVAVGLVVFLAASAGDGPAGGSPAVTADDRASVADFRHALRSQGLWHVGTVMFLAFSLYIFFNSWMPSYLADRFGMSLADSGVQVALFPAVGLVSRSLGGYVSDRYFESRRRPVEVTAFLVTTPVVLLVGFVGFPVVVAALLVVAGFFIQLAIALLYTHARELVDESVAATGVSFVSSTALLGSFSAPLVAGALLQWSGGYLPAFLSAGAAATAGLVLAWTVPERARPSGLQS